MATKQIILHLKTDTSFRASYRKQRGFYRLSKDMQEHLIRSWIWHLCRLREKISTGEKQ